MKKIQTKSIDAVVNFNRPLSCDELVNLIDDALEEYNKVAKNEWKKHPFLKRIFKRCYNYTVCCYSRMFYSIDGMIEKKTVNYPLEPELYPDAKYEYMHMIFIYEIRKNLYFNVIPGPSEAKQLQFGTWIKDNKISSITIEANIKSSPYWEGIQLKFLQKIVPIIERIDKRRETTE